MRVRYPFRDLKAVGEALHFHMPQHTERERRRIREAAYQHGQRNGTKYSVFKSNCGINVKRIA